MPLQAMSYDSHFLNQNKQEEKWKEVIICLTRQDDFS